MSLPARMQQKLGESVSWNGGLVYGRLRWYRQSQGRQYVSEEHGNMFSVLDPIETRRDTPKCCTSGSNGHLDTCYGTGGLLPTSADDFNIGCVACQLEWNTGSPKTGKKCTRL